MGIRAGVTKITAPLWDTLLKFSRGLLNRIFKFVAITLLLALAAPAASALALCVQNRPAHKLCEPDCPMIVMDGGSTHQIAAMPTTEGSCCQVSSQLPVSNRSAVMPETQGVGNVLALVSATHTALPAARSFMIQRTAPPVCASSHQALLCVFLV
jgi:hypothetical protein